MLSAWARPAAARNTITQNAGCSDEFKGNKKAIKDCMACVGGHGRYKKDANKKVWSCEAGAATGETAADIAPTGDVGPKGRGEGAPAAPPATLPKYHTDYALIPAGKFRIGSPDSEQGRQAMEFQAAITIRGRSS